jgi:potassium-dependent mechanosensitive channel
MGVWRLVVLLCVLVGGVCVAPGFGQGDGGKGAGGTAAATGPAVGREPRGFALKEVSGQVEATAADLESIKRLLQARERLDAIEMELPALTEEIASRQAESSRVMSPSASLEVLADMEKEWEAVRVQISRWQAELTDRAEELQGIHQRLMGMQKSWTLTLEMLGKASAETAVIERLKPINEEIGRMETVLDQQQAALGSVLNQINIQNVRVTEFLVTVRQAQSRAVDRLTTRDSPGIWVTGDPGGAKGREGAGLGYGTDSFSRQWDAVRTYVKRSPGSVLLHLGVVLVIAGALVWMRPHVREELAHDARAAQAAVIFQHPVMTAYVLSIFGATRIYSSAPRILWTLVGAVGLVALVVILRQMVERATRLVLYAAIVLCFLRLTQSVVASHPVLSRWLFIVEMGGTAGFVVMFLWSQRHVSIEQIKEMAARGAVRVGQHGGRGLAYALMLILVVAVASVMANILGYVALAKVLAGGVVMIVYMSMLGYLSVNACDALLLGAMSVRPLIMLRMVRREGVTIRRWCNRLFALGAVSFGLWYVLEAFAIRKPVVSLASTVLWAQWQSGPVRLSLGYVILLVLTVAASFTISRLIRFMLEEDIYPHLSLGRGIPYAVSTLLHYVILLVGFLAAISTVYDLSQFTILASAFGIGLGFGLQNVVSNFVSGLILLFERPVQVGDVIEVAGAPVTVTRIGIRASVVRTSSAAEIIIPNGQLISDKVTNWTLSNRQRGLEVTVGCARTVPAERVIALLMRVAKETAGVAQTPEPTVVIVSMNAASFGYQLSAWTALEDWSATRSELLKGVSQAFEKEGLALA